MTSKGSKRGQIDRNISGIVILREILCEGIIGLIYSEEVE